jgi:DHA1 family multidrug resistance protein-like MFS transporter
MKSANSIKQKTLSSLWRSVFWVSFPFGVLGFLLPVYGRQLGASALEIGGMFSVFSLVPALIRPFLGRALDRWGRRPFLLMGLGGYMVATLVFSLANSVVLLTAARFLQGIGSAFLWIAAFTMIADLAGPEGRGHNFGAIDEASYRGGIIGTSIGLVVFILLGESAGLSYTRIWFGMFTGFLIPVLLANLIAWSGAAETRPEEINRIKKPSRISRQLLALMGIVLVTGGSQAMVWPLLMIFLQDRLGAGIGSLAVAYLPAALISSFLPSRTGRLADRWGRKIPMIVGLVIGALASLLIPKLKSVISLAALWVVETVGYAISVPAERAFVADIAGEDVRGSSYGWYTFSFFLGAVLGPLAGGWLYDYTGKDSPFFLNSAILILGAVLVGVFLKEPHRDPGSCPDPDRPLA